MQNTQMKTSIILGTGPEIINDKELMEGLKRSKRDVEEGRVYELKNVDDFDKIWKFDNFTQVRT